MTVPSSFQASALVDFHCHLDLYPDHLELVARCEREAVYTLAVTTTPKAWARNKQVTSSTKYVRAALGLHPQLVESRQGELAMWRDLASETRYIGEIGLDGGPRYFRSMTQQQAVFGAILDRCAELGDRILTIHSVRSVKTVMDMIEAKLPRSRGRAVMHWFTGSSSELRRAVDLGCYFSVNQAMLDEDKRRALARAIPIDRLLTETDGPFTKMGEKPSVPSDVARTVIELARMHATEPVTMARRITSNLRSLVG